MSLFIRSAQWWSITCPFSSSFRIVCGCFVSPFFEIKSRLAIVCAPVWGFGTRKFSFNRIIVQVIDRHFDHLPRRKKDERNPLSPRISPIDRHLRLAFFLVCYLPRHVDVHRRYLSRKEREFKMNFYILILKFAQ